MQKKKAYLVGIKGIAMTSLAVYLKEKGYNVTGSDVSDIFPTDKVLKANKIKIKKGFSEKNIDESYDVVVVTGAHGGMTNPEARQAKTLNLPTFMHGEYLGKILKNKFGISVAGCHGKTTTSSLIAFLLEKAGLKPSYAIGTAEINGLGAAGHFGRGNIFIAEADEYMTCPMTDPTPRFMWQDPKILVVTNIEYDHPDEFADISQVKEAFLNFINKLDKDTIVVANIDSQNVADILPNINNQVITYGFSPRADFSINRFYFEEGISFMRVKHKDLDLGEYMLKVPGKHNMANALATIIVADQVGVGRDKIKNNLSQFTGCKRRFEKIAQVGDVLLYDDYAHHPSEIVATISSANEWFPEKRLIVLFQPHTFSRTKALLPEFARSFSGADLALISDIYPSAREENDETINSIMLVGEANKYKMNAYYLKDKKRMLSFLDKNIKDGDLIITMGAGDIYLWLNDLQKLLLKKFS